MYPAGGYRRQLPRLLHHTLYRGSLRLTHLHHLHLRGLGETHPPGGPLSLQQEQQPGQTHHVLVCGHIILTQYPVVNQSNERSVITKYVSWRYCKSLNR